MDSTCLHPDDYSEQAEIETENISRYEWARTMARTIEGPNAIGKPYQVRSWALQVFGRSRRSVLQSSVRQVGRCGRRPLSLWASRMCWRRRSSGWSGLGNHGNFL